MVFNSCGELQSRRIKRKKIVPIIRYSIVLLCKKIAQGAFCNKYRRAQGLNAWEWFTARLRDETNCLRCKLINISRWFLTENNCTSKITSYVKIRWFFSLKNTCAYFLCWIIHKENNKCNLGQKTDKMNTTIAHPVQYHPYVNYKSKVPGQPGNNIMSSGLLKGGKKRVKNMFTALYAPCQVCGDRATGYHYGADTCEACKVNTIYIYVRPTPFFNLWKTSVLFAGATDTPILDFWWRLLWVSKPEFIPSLVCFVAYAQQTNAPNL